MSRHPQLSRRQLTDLLDRAFSELEAWNEMIAEVYTSNLSQMARIAYADGTLVELQRRIKALIERLAEYK